jgi:hypothetical protein
MAIRDDIAKYAYDAADKFIRHKIAMNDTIHEQATKNSLNSEVVKRVCEEANKNVYLAMFKSDGVDKTKIEFPRAEDSTILSKIQADNSDVADYILPPGKPVTPVLSPASDEMPARELSSAGTRDALYETMNKIKNMLSSVQTMMSQEKKASEQNYQKLYGSLKKLAHHESYGDICKLAMRFSAYAELDSKASSEILKYAGDHLGKEVALRFDITKTADGTLDPAFPLFQEFEACVHSIEKVAGWTELEANLSRGASTVESIVTGKGLEKNAQANNLYNLMKEICK